MVIGNSLPEFSDIQSFILISLNGWSYFDMSMNFICFSAFYVPVVFYLINKVKGVKFNSYMYCVFVAKGLTQLIQFNLLMWKYFNYNMMFFAQIL